MVGSTLIITAHNGADPWYARGQIRMCQTLSKFYGGEIVAWQDWPNDNFNKECPYNIKASAMELAITMDYDMILWLDCSMYAIKSLDPIFNWIEEKGLYTPMNGMNVCEETSDKCLDYFKVSRDDAENMRQCSSGIMGFDMRQEKGRDFVSKWIKSSKDGAFNGSRGHDEQSQDPRFKCHRQDQSAASLIIYELGLQNCMDQLGNYVDYYTKDKKYNENTCLLCQGGI